jgi:hypothetical protein
VRLKPRADEEVDRVLTLGNDRTNRLHVSPVRLKSRARRNPRLQHRDFLRGQTLLARRRHRVVRIVRLDSTQYFALGGLPCGDRDKVIRIRLVEPQPAFLLVRTVTLEAVLGQDRASGARVSRVRDGSQQQ